MLLSAFSASAAIACGVFSGFLYAAAGEGAVRAADDGAAASQMRQNFAILVGFLTFYILLGA